MSDKFEIDLIGKYKKWVIFIEVVARRIDYVSIELRLILPIQSSLPSRKAFFWVGFFIKRSVVYVNSRSANIDLFRDTIIYFTASGAARGVSGHTGGPFDTVPELVLLLALFEHSKKYLPIVFDEAGHRVATQYLLSALEGHIPTEQLLHYREANSKLPGHPEVRLLLQYSNSFSDPMT